ncbi:helicase C-terminal domain-containing protein [uncultured Limosilactobacillus sp.]|uniref:helicase C-terminal domain-containing protein n=1 Tax=uncultured Limosilactobacillus sp. TaxID=2837629 RepID=UPI0025CFBAF6|nr:helicase C-terminal domain-containing protein [uncultured Limosilactobacillus sp.]
MTMKTRQRQPIYSVVDLETTGTSFKNGDRIIQIGLVMIQEGQIINHFETRINPLMKIPRSVQQLTGITDKDVRKAPLLEDVAPTVESLLSGTIFVAHNVNFDFPFLNHELERVGRDPLRISAIDTVTLSQILMPTAKSYRLRDLTSYLKIEHDHPHSAVSDAEATGVLLNDLLTKLKQLPTVTLKKLVEMEMNLPFQTARLFQRELDRRAQHPLALANDLFISGGIALHKERPIAVESAQSIHYPRLKRQKQRLFSHYLEYRPLQSKMMNAIYNHFSRSGNNQLVIEAGTGMGKTLGYLLPLSYLTYPQHKIVISTATNILQEQLIAKPMEQLNQVLPFNMTAVMVKGSAHYLNLSKFVHSLSVHDDSQLVQMIKAQILVWLLQTTTGDLDELNLNSQRSPFFTEIRHHGIASLSKDDPLYRFDFLVRRQKKLSLANVIVTNHSYLVAHAQELGATSPLTYLVIDEAQHLSQSVLRNSRDEISFPRAAVAVNQLQSLTEDENEQGLAKLFQKLPLGQYNLELMRSDLHEFREALEYIQQALYGMLEQSSINDGEEFIEKLVDNRDLLELLSPDKSLMIRLEQALASLKLHFTALQHLFNARNESWLSSDRYVMNQVGSQMEVLAHLDEHFRLVVQNLRDEDDAAVYWINVRQSSERSTLRLTGGLLAANHYLRENVYAYFYRQLFVGATLFTSQRSNYLYQQLDLDPKNVKSKRFPSAFDYQNNARLYIATDAEMPNQQNTHPYINYLAKSIYRIAQENQCQTMILFNSLVTIEQVYGLLRKTDLFNQRDILAQGINGNREKLLKQFATGTNSILMGANSFWEGIDLPNQQLQLLIVTRLPFDSPDEPFTKAEHQLLKQLGRNPFYGSALPKATIRIRQGIGRLLRTPQDYGVATILDSRLAQRRYGQTIINALPKGLVVEKVPTSQIAAKAKKFLKQRQQHTNED